MKKVALYYYCHQRASVIKYLGIDIPEEDCGCGQKSDIILIKLKKATVIESISDLCSSCFLEYIKVTRNSVTFLGGNLSGIT